MTTTGADDTRLRMGARLREAREYLGFSQDEAAKALEVSRPAITNIESGQRKVEALELEKLARLYGRSVSFLLTGEDEEPGESKQVAFAARALQGLSERDLEEVLRFANYLRRSSKTSSRKDR